MSLDLLDTPLRATWDLGGDRHLPLAHLHDLATRLVDGGLFFVSLDNPPRGAVVAELSQILADGGCQVSLVAPGAAVLPPAGLPLERLLLDVAGWCRNGAIVEQELALALESARSAGYQPGLLMVPQRWNIALIPKLLIFCRDHEIPVLKLPNVPVCPPGAGIAFGQLPGPQDIARLRGLLEEVPLVPADSPRLEVHDLFLWELLCPDLDRSNYSGCQAGNSVAHVAADGILYPCSSWPDPMGSLLEQPLVVLWGSARRQAVRDVIAVCPSGCADCSVYRTCLGGCRGLSVCCGDSRSGGRDLMCGGKR